MRFMPWVNCGQEKEFRLRRLKGFIPLEEITLFFLDKNKITNFICLINHCIFPPNM